MILEIKDRKSMQDGIERLCAFLLERGVASERVFDSKLVASELLGNVFKHTNGTAILKVEIVDGEVRLKVSSNVAFIPPEKTVCSDVFSEHGRGLYIVDCVCERRTTTDEGEIVVTIKTK